MSYRIGTWSEIPTPYAAHIMAKAGMDFIIIDMEHGVHDFTTAQSMIFAMHSEGKKAFVRVPVIAEEYILRVLDMGADGVICPQVSGVRDIKAILAYSLYAPAGERGFNPYVTAGNYGDIGSNYFVEENCRLELGIILEGKEGLACIDEILAYDEINVVYLGQYDLSMALGVPGEVNHPLVTNTLDEMVKKINASGKQAGCMVHSVEEGKIMIEKGFQFISYKVDSGILYSAVKKFIEGVAL